MKLKYPFSILLYFWLNFLQAFSVQTSPEKVNIIILLADDLGYRDLSCYGGVAKTPHIDEIAKKGFLFTNFYAAAPNCSPSRAALLTGINPSRLGFYNYLANNDPVHLRDSEETIAEMLKQRGYQTGYFGKWHLGSLDDTSFNHPKPKDQGFDYFFGTEANARPSHLNPINFIRNGKKLPKQEGYSCQIIATEAIDWIKKNNKEPFFIEVAFHEPHKKVASPPLLTSHYSQFPAKDAEYLANVENLDLAVGKIYMYLKESNQLENTFILFSSDNGSYRDASNGELKGVKSFLYEGGIRVPGIISYKPRLNKGVKIDVPVSLIDIFPTLKNITSANYIKEENLDGTSFLDLLEGKQFERKKPLFWFFYRTSPEIAIRIGDTIIMGKDHDTIPRSHSFSKQDMKYIQNITLKEFEMYDLKTDISQSVNLFNNSKQREWYRHKLTDKLKEIKDSLYIWNNLEKTSKAKKIKTRWVELPKN